MLRYALFAGFTLAEKTSLLSPPTSPSCAQRWTMPPRARRLPEAS
jgi:hypothetical protein